MVLLISSRLERLGWSIVIAGQDDMRIVSQFGVCREMLAYLASHPADVVLVDETTLTPRCCESLRSYGRRSRTRFLLVALHPHDGVEESTRYSFASQRLLKGISAAELLAAIRRGRRSRIAARPEP